MLNLLKLGVKSLPLQIRSKWCVHDFGDVEVADFRIYEYEERNILSISVYEHPIYDKLVDNGWNLYKYNSVNACSDRTECLWYNYDIEEGDLFNEI